MMLFGSFMKQPWALAGLDLTLIHLYGIIEVLFQSTRPSRASTVSLAILFQVMNISIHKALAGLDSKANKDSLQKIRFQSTRPSRASTIKLTANSVSRNISIHKALAGLDEFSSGIFQILLLFQSTRPSRASTAIFTNFVSTFFIFLNIMLHFYLDNLLSLSKNSYFPCPFPTFSSANIPSFPCPLHIRIKKSTVLSHQIRALLLYAPPYFYIGSPDNKISGCLYLYR